MAWWRAAISGTDRFLSDLAGRRRPAMLVLALVTLLMLLPGFFTMPPIDQDEVLYAQASRQMAASGDFVDIRFGTGPRYKKPAGIYWLQATADLLTGDPAAAPIWVNRIPSLLAGIGSVLATYWIGTMLAGASVGFVGALLLATSVLLGFEARVATTDSVLLFTILTSMAALVRAFVVERREETASRGWGAMLAFWLGLSAGVLVKGPIAPMVVGATAAGASLLERSWRWLRGVRPAIGILVFALVTAPWFIAIWFVSHGTFYGVSVGGDFLAKVGQGQEAHGRPFGTYAATFFVYFWPAAPLVLFGVPYAIRHRHERWVTFGLAWVVPAWLVFEIAVTKLPNYVLPLLPAIALLSAAGLLDFLARRAPGWRVWVIGVLLLSGFAFPLGIGYVAGMFGQALPWWAWLAAILAALALATALAALRMRAAFGAVAALGIGAFLLNFSFYPVAARLDAMWPGPRLAQVVRTYDGCKAPAIAASGYIQPSLVFWLGPAVTRGGPSEVVRTLTRNTCAVGLVEARHLARVEKDLGAAGVETRDLATVRGLDLGSGRTIAVHVLARVNAN